MEPLSPHEPPLRPSANPLNTFWLDFDRESFYETDVVSPDEIYDTIIIGTVYSIFHNSMAPA
jgi:hypothetical protein